MIPQRLIDAILTHPDTQQAIRDALAYNPNLASHLRLKAFLDEWRARGTEPAGAD